MKVIDLYIKHANGEDLPEKIEIGNNVFKLNETGDIYYTGVYNDIPLSMEWDLNDEVKIIEEEKDIEPLAKLGNYKVNTGDDFLDKVLTNINERINHLIDKQTEIIDAVNELRKEK